MSKATSISDGRGMQLPIEGDRLTCYLEAWGWVQLNSRTPLVGEGCSLDSGQVFDPTRCSQRIRAER